MESWSIEGDPRQAATLERHLRVSGQTLWVWLGVDET